MRSSTAPAVEQVGEAEQFQQFVGTGGAGLGDPEVECQKSLSVTDHELPQKYGRMFSRFGLGCSRSTHTFGFGHQFRAARGDRVDPLGGQRQRYTTRRGMAVAFIGTTDDAGERSPAGACAFSRGERLVGVARFASIRSRRPRRGRRRRAAATGRRRRAGWGGSRRWT